LSPARRKALFAKLAAANPAPATEFAAAAPRIAALYEGREFGAAIREIAALADRANQYIDAHKPWILAKDPARAGEVASVCTQGLNLFRALMIYLQPVLPVIAERAAEFLGHPLRHWNDVATPLLGTVLAPYQPLATRLDPKVVASLVAPEPEPAAPSAPEISIEEFGRIDLRVARVAAAEQVAGADKLLKLTVDLGTEMRTVFAGIRGAYAPEQLVGRHVVVVANLTARKMRFGVSQGMVLAAADDSGLFVVGPDAGAVAGMRVR
jgi:methionyl-tRNA synthetase